jgi:hypothetical protein
MRVATSDGIWTGSGASPLARRAGGTIDQRADHSLRNDLSESAHEIFARRRSAERTRRSASCSMVPSSVPATTRRGEAVSQSSSSSRTVARGPPAGGVTAYEAKTI